MKLTKYSQVMLAGLLILWVSATAKAETVQATDFTLKSQSGDNLRLAEMRGNIVLINFWASWCAPCRKELPYLEEIQQEFQDLGFTVLAVNIDEDSAKANNLLSDIPVSFPVVLDPTGKVSKLYEVAAMPTTVFIDRDGNQRLIHPGYKQGDEQKYRKIIKTLIRE
ncbi:TlpA disulfide reductase family protein [Neptunicella sp. SCSIO 80796]|uniref:TlpA disulfide reductase family protein n=1 Tax=Neptunicella plasticusilytica TaxID=3117012 RepID=UPI003A4DA1E4